MESKTWSNEKVKEILDACIQHTWQKEKRQKDFRALGFESPEMLSNAVETGLKEPATRSFDRIPSVTRGQSEPTRIFQIQLRDPQGKTHSMTVSLNPDRSSDGSIHGGTAFINKRERRPQFQIWLNKEYERGYAPNVLLRGSQLGQAAEQALKSPISRLDAKFNILDPAAVSRMNRTPSQNAERQQRPNEALFQRFSSPPPLSKTHAREDLTPTRAEQMKQEANRRANETMAERWQRERAGRSQQDEKSQDRSKEQERSPGAETMAQKWLRERPAQPPQQDAGHRDTQTQERHQREREQDR